MTRSVLITDCDMGPATLEREVLQAAGYEVTHQACRTEDEVIAAVRETEAVGLLVQYVPITRRVLEKCPGVRGLARYGVGLDNVDLDAARELGVTVLNVPDYGAAEVADQATTLMLSLLRGVPAWSAATARGEWPARGALPEPLELRGSVLGLVGFGAIAREVAVRAQAFGMRVLAHDPYVDDSAVTAAGAHPVSWGELWSTSTAVSLHAPLTASTRGLVDWDALSRAGPGAFLVNTARAGLVDREALVRALAEGNLAGVGLDVWWQEPADPADPLLGHPQVLVTPHVAWLSPGSVQRLRAGAARRLLNVLEPESKGNP